MSRDSARRRRQRRVRKKVVGTPVRPRLNVYRSNKHIYAQLIDDMFGETLAAASSCEEELRQSDVSGRDMAFRVGQLVAERAQEAGIDKVVFDRAGYKYHGQIESLAEGARDAGLEF